MNVNHPRLKNYFIFLIKQLPPRAFHILEQAGITTFEDFVTKYYLEKTVPEFRLFRNCGTSTERQLKDFVKKICNTPDKRIPLIDERMFYPPEKSVSSFQKKLKAQSKKAVRIFLKTKSVTKAAQRTGISKELAYEILRQNNIPVAAHKMGSEKANQIIELFEKEMSFEQIMKLHNISGEKLDWLYLKHYGIRYKVAGRKKRDDEIIRLIKGNHSVAQIAEKFNLCAPYVREIAKKHGCKIKNATFNYRVRKLIIAGFPPSKIAKMTGCTTQNVYGIRSLMKKSPKSFSNKSDFEKFKV